MEVLLRAVQSGKDEKVFQNYFLVKSHRFFLILHSDLEEHLCNFSQKNNLKIFLVLYQSYHSKEDAHAKNCLIVWNHVFALDHLPMLRSSS